MNSAESDIWSQIDKSLLPRHVAIIMDGNGRWAEKKGLPRIAGHREGVKTVDRIVSIAREIDIKHLTLYSFSTENWNRPRPEVEALMAILREFLVKEMKRMMSNNIRFGTIGKISDLPQTAVGIINEVKEATKNNDGTVLTLALSYGSRDEIVDAAKALGRKVKKGEIDPEDIDSDNFGKELYTAGLPDVDLMVRTSGELRVSNFLLWQIAYAELFFSDKLWPDFEGVDLLSAVKAFQERERRFGLSGEQLVEANHSSKKFHS